MEIKQQRIELITDRRNQHEDGYEWPIKDLKNCIMFSNVLGQFYKFATINHSIFIYCQNLKTNNVQDLNLEEAQTIWRTK